MDTKPHRCNKTIRVLVQRSIIRKKFHYHIIDSPYCYYICEAKTNNKRQQNLPTNY